MEKYEELANHLQEAIPFGSCEKNALISLIYDSEIKSLNELIEFINCLAGIVSCRTSLENLDELAKKDITSGTYGEMINSIYEHADFEKYK